MVPYRITDLRYSNSIHDSSDPDTLIVTRTGLLFGDVSLGSLGGAWTVTVDGTIQGALELAADNVSGSTAPGSTIMIGRAGLVHDDVTGVLLRNEATVKNYGLIAGETGIELSEGDSHGITNAGTVTGSSYSIHDANMTGSSKDQVTNLGTLDGHVDLGGGDDTLVNSGRIFGRVDLGDGGDFFKVSGRGLVTGDIYLGAGNDTFVESGRGLVLGRIYLDAGNDTFNGGAGAETVSGGAGTDKIDLGGGNDTFYAFEGSGGDSDETIKGGSGSDTYDATGALARVIINLDKIKHDDTAANTATGTGIGTDTLVGFENATGGGGSDIFYGSGAGNVLNGGNGLDYLLGFGGNDSLYGGDDLSGDQLTGGLGRDTLTGGGGADEFVFNSVAESGKTLATCDVITDFVHGQDKITLTNIDADTKQEGDDGFHIINNGNGGSFHHTPGELRFSVISAGTPGGFDTLVEGDANGDGRADFAIRLKGSPGSIVLDANDFNL